MRAFLAALILCLFVAAVSPVSSDAASPANPTGASSIDRGDRRGSGVFPASVEIVAHPRGCPARLFCGCGVSIKVFGHSVRALWRVANWYRFPRAAPAAGNVVLFGTRHVAYIEQAYGDGTALLYDPNSGGGLTRIHVVPIRGLTVVDPHRAFLRQGKRGARWASSAF